MIPVDDVLVCDDVVDVAFACILEKCKGACCTLPGGTGAPLAPDERARLEAVYPRVRKYLPKTSVRVIEEFGTWEEIGPGLYTTRCVGRRECVFVTFEGDVAKCAIQKAYQKGEVDWPKPISCHLFPLRAATHGDQEVLNYVEIAECHSARRNGLRRDVPLFEFLKAPLVRKYGENWYAMFHTACQERRISPDRNERNQAIGRSDPRDGASKEKG